MKNTKTILFSHFRNNELIQQTAIEIPSNKVRKTFLSLFGQHNKQGATIERFIGLDSHTNYNLTVLYDNGKFGFAWKSI